MTLEGDLVPWWQPYWSSSATALGLYGAVLRRVRWSFQPTASQALRRSLWQSERALVLLCYSCCHGLHFQPTPVPEIKQRKLRERKRENFSFFIIFSATKQNLN